MFYYIKQGRSFGPVSGRDLVELFDTGVLTTDDVVRMKSAQQWLPATGVIADIRAGRLPDVPVEPGSGPSVRPPPSTVFTSAVPMRPDPASSPPRGDATGTTCLVCAKPAVTGAAFCQHCGAVIQR